MAIFVGLWEVGEDFQFKDDYHMTTCLNHVNTEETIRIRKGVTADLPGW
jgi:hypothetical protein